MQPTPFAVAPCDHAACAAQGIEVFVEPDVGAAPVLRAIHSAQISIWVYLLTDRNVLRALEDAAARSLDVRVLLEMSPYGSGSVAPTETLAELQAAGVQARGANSAYRYTHEKAIVVDGATALILTCNLTRTGLGGSTQYANREYGVIDGNAEDVAEVRTIFLADWNRTLPTLTDPRLLVSPQNARAGLSRLLAGAQTTLRIEDEEMYDSASEDQLIAAAQRGVQVQLVLPTPATDGSSADQIANVARLRQGGVHVRYITTPYMHAKLVVSDDSLAFTGSENFSANSLDANREVGLVIADPAALVTFNATFAQDWLLSRDA